MYFLLCCVSRMSLLSQQDSCGDPEVQHTSGELTTFDEGVEQGTGYEYSEVKQETTTDCVHNGPGDDIDLDMACYEEDPVQSFGSMDMVKETDHEFSLKCEEDEPDKLMDGESPMKEEYSGTFGTGEAPGVGSVKDAMSRLLEGTSVFADDGAQMEESTSIPTLIEGFECSTCHAKFMRRKELMKHEWTHEGVRPFVCIVCQKGFKSDYKLQKHVTNTHVLAKDHICKECGSAFNSKASLATHMRLHTGERPYSCRRCSKTFAHRTSLDRHELLHTGARPYCCTVCGVSFTQRSHLLQHAKRHENIEKTFRCKTCNAAFELEKSLKKHEMLHTGEKPYKCEVCGSGFTYAQSYRRHLTTHKPEKPYKCETCGTSFRQPDCLRVHLRTHTGERPFSCDLCGMAFRQSGTLRNHIQKIHTQEKPFICTECDQTFSSQSALAKHSAKHSQTKNPKKSKQTKKVKDNVPQLTDVN